MICVLFCRYIRMKVKRESFTIALRSTVLDTADDLPIIRTFFEGSLPLPSDSGY